MIKPTLVMAKTDSITFEVTMSGAQEEDFELPIYAILTGSDGTYRKVQIGPDTRYLTFDGLTPGTEYVIRIENEEKVFSEQSYFTAEEEDEKGSISADINGNNVTVQVGDVSLKDGEYYTVIVKDADGNVVFSRDGVDPNATYSFSVSDPGSLYFTLEIGGKTYDMSSIVVEVEEEEEEPGEPEYDLDNASWTWSADYEGATVSFEEVNGGEPLVLTATVAKELTEPTCEEDGFAVCTATLEYEGRSYTDEQTVVDEGSALGHKYGEPTFEWVETEDGFQVSATLVCENDPSHVEQLSAAVVAEETPATCETDGSVTYTATVEADGTSYTDERLVLLEGSALDHEYAAPVFGWAAEDEGYTVSAAFVCNRDISHIERIFATVTSVVTPAVCEVDGYITYTAKVSLVGREYSDVKVDVIPALGHEYLYDSFVWDGFTAKAKYICSHDAGHIDLHDATVTSEVTTAPLCETTGIRTYTATYDTHNDTKDEVLAKLGHEYLYDSFVWDGFTAKAKYICSHDAGHIDLHDATVTSKVTTAPLCESTGIRTYTATYDTHNDTKDEVLAKLGHTYGSLISENYNGNGLKAHYECSACHKLFDENKVEKTEKELKMSTGTAISLNDGPLCINPTGYARSESGLSSPTPFVSSAASPYLIQNQNVDGCDNIIQVYNSDQSTANIYIKLKDVTLSAGSWCSLFLIKNAKNTVNITLIIEGSVTFAGGSGQQIFSSQGYGSPTVNIIIDQTTAGGTFNAQISDGLTYAQSGSIKVSYK